MIRFFSANFARQIWLSSANLHSSANFSAFVVERFHTINITTSCNSFNMRVHSRSAPPTFASGSAKHLQDGFSNSGQCSKMLSLIILYFHLLVSKAE